MLWKYLVLTKNSMFWLQIATSSSVTPSGLLNFLFLTALCFCLWDLCPLFDVFGKEGEAFVEASVCRMSITEAGWLICWNLGVNNLGWKGGHLVQLCSEQIQLDHIDRGLVSQILSIFKDGDSTTSLSGCHRIWSYLRLEEKKKTILVCNQNFSCSNLSAASRHFTVDLQEESGSIFSRQLYTAVRFAGLLFSRSRKPSSQPRLVQHVLQPHTQASGLHWARFNISMSLLYCGAQTCT